MSGEQLMRNFLQQYRKPYSLADLEGFLGLEREEIERLHGLEVEAGNVWEPEPGIYISALAHETTVTRSMKSGKRTVTLLLDALRAQGMLDALEARKIASSRELGRAVGVSHQLACQYLTALMSIGAVEVTPEGYRVKHRDMSRLGLDYEDGIIGKQRRQAGLKTGPQEDTDE